MLKRTLQVISYLKLNVEDNVVLVKHPIQLKDSVEQIQHSTPLDIFGFNRLNAFALLVQ